MTSPHSPESPSSRASSLATATQIAEIAASLAVLITLIFLVLEVRQNTATTRVASYDRSMELLNEWRLTVASDPVLAGDWVDYVSRTDGNRSMEADIRLNMVLGTLWGIYENAYVARERGFLGPSEWTRFEVQTCRQYDLAVENERWDGDPRGTVTSMRSLLTEEFAKFVESNCTG